jgi:hypothetical protein
MQCGIAILILGIDVNRSELDKRFHSVDGIHECAHLCILPPEVVDSIPKMKKK